MNTEQHIIYTLFRFLTVKKQFFSFQVISGFFEQHIIFVRFASEQYYYIYLVLISSCKKQVFSFRVFSGIFGFSGRVTSGSGFFGFGFGSGRVAISNPIETSSFFTFLFLRLLYFFYIFSKRKQNVNVKSVFFFHKKYVKTCMTYNHNQFIYKRLTNF